MSTFEVEQGVPGNGTVRLGHGRGLSPVMSGLALLPVFGVVTTIAVAVY
jgi:hypothetical protein